MTYAYIIPIVASVVLALVGGYEITNWINGKPKFKVPDPHIEDYTRNMEAEFDRRDRTSRNPLLTTIGGRTRRRKK